MQQDGTYSGQAIAIQEEPCRADENRKHGKPEPHLWLVDTFIALRKEENRPVTHGAAPDRSEDAAQKGREVE